MKFGSFGETGMVELVFDFAGRAESGNKDSDDAKNDKDKKSPGLKPNGKGAEAASDNK